MDGEGDQYEERLREVFQSFDGSSAGSLNPEELTELCQALQLNPSALHTLLHTLLQSQDKLTARVEFEAFKNALIVVLSSNEETLTDEENPTQPGSPEVQPRFVKGGKRYGRRSTPEFTHGLSELTHTPAEEEEEEEEEDGDEETLPSKRECWNPDVSISEEYEAEGQLHLWNPDEPGTPRGSLAPPIGLEEKLQSVCQQLSLPLQGTATLQQLHTLCQHLGVEVGEDAFQAVGEECVMSVQEFVSYIVNKNKPPTPSASTPYRQLKRHHSMQPFDEMGRRTSSLLSSTIGLRLFSGLDDGTGHIPVEQLLDTWLEEGVDNCPEILQALDFSLDGRVNLSELTAALENELLITKNSIHQAALVSFKAEIRHLLERVDLELREKEKIRSDLEKAEKLKSQLASEVDEHHSAIERINDLNLRKLEEENKDRMVALRVELSKEVELVQQLANQQREDLEQEIRRIRDDETFLREHLTLTVKENGRLEAELLDSTERLMEAESQLSKLQRNLDSVLKEKFGDLDLSNADFYQQEERLRQLRSNYEEQCRELQDRIDELQAQLVEFRALGRAPQSSLLPSLSDELESKSPGMESDPGLGSEEGQPFNMSLEAEMMLEQLKEQHVREVENFREQLDSTMSEYRSKLEEQKSAYEEERSSLSLQHQQEIQALKDEAAEALSRACDLQEQLEQEKHNMEVRQDVERNELLSLHQQELSCLNQEVQEARNHALQLKEQLRAAQQNLEICLLEERERLQGEREEAEKRLAEEKQHLEEIHKEVLRVQLEEVQQKAGEEKTALERRLGEEWEKEKQHLEEVHKEVLRLQLEEVQCKAEQERVELERRLGEEWEKEEVHKEALRVQLEEVQSKAEQERVELERRLKEEWEKEKQHLEEVHKEALRLQLEEVQCKAEQERVELERRLGEEWEKEKQYLEEVHKEALRLQLEEVQSKAEQERLELKRRLGEEWEKEKQQIEESNKAALQAVLEEELLRLLKEQEDRERRISEQWEEERTLLEEQHHAELRHRVQLERERARAQEESDCRRMEEWEREKALLQKHYDEVLQARLEEQRERLQMEREDQERRWQEVLEEEQSRMQEAHREAMQELSVKHKEERERLSCLLEKLRTDIGEERKELEIHFSQRLKEVEARFSGDQDAVSERFQADIHKLEHHYQSELAGLNQRQAVDRARWEEEMEAMIQEAEQQRRLLREALQLERENLVLEFTQEREKLEQSHAEDVEALRKRNLELNNELENFVSSAQTKEITLSRQLNELHNRLQDNLEAKDALLLHSESRTEELEQLLRQATEDFAQERAELQTSLSELEGRHAETLTLVEKHLQEQNALLTEREELKRKMEEMEKVLHQAVEDFHYERLELQGVMAALEEKLKEKMKEEEQRTELMAEREKLVHKVLQMESELGEDGRKPDLPDLKVSEMECLCAENEDETVDHQSEDFSVLGEESPSAQDEEFDGELLLQEKHPEDFDDTLTVSHLINICNDEVLNCSVGDCIDTMNLCLVDEASAQQDSDELTNVNNPGSASTTVVVKNISKLAVSFAVSISSPQEIEVTDHEFVDDTRPVDATVIASNEVVDLISPDHVVEDKEDVEVRQPVNEIPSIVSEDDKIDIHCSSVDGLEEVVEFDNNAIVEPDAELAITNISVVDKAEIDGSAVNSDGLRSMKESVLLYSKYESHPEVELESGLLCPSQEMIEVLGREGDVKTVTPDTASLDNNVDPSFETSAVVSDEEFSNMQNAEANKREIAERIVAWCTDIPEGLTKDLEEHVDDSEMTALVEEDQGQNEAQEDIGEVTMAGCTDEPNIVEVADQSEMPESMDEAEIKEENDGAKCQDLIVDLEHELMPNKEQEESALVEGYKREVHELQDIPVQVKDQSSSLEVLQDQYSNAVQQNLSLHEQLAWLQRHTAELELLLELNRGKLDETHELRVELITMAAQAKELEIKELELAELQMTYEECVCENAQLADHNRTLEMRVHSLEIKMRIIQEFHLQQASLLEEVERVREENVKLRSAVQELEKQEDEAEMMLQQDVESSESSDDSSLDFSSQVEVKITEMSELEDCCSEFEKQNSGLRLALTHLQDKSLRIQDRMQEHRSEAGRLAEENLILRQKISALREEDLRENKHELLLQVEHFRKERNSAQKMADGLKRQISELRRRGHQLEEENNVLSQQNVKHALSVDTLQHTLEEVIRQNGNGPSNERRELENGDSFAVSVITTEKLEEEKELLKAELNRCVEKMTRLRSVETQLAQLLNERQTTDKHNQALRSQLMKAQEKVQALDSTLHGLTQQNARLKSDLRITQQERDALKQEVISLHKQLQNANEKCRLVEMSISGGSQQGKRMWAELSGLMEAELTLLREENQRLQRETNDARLELNSAREKGRQLEALVLSVKQQKLQNQASLAKAAEQERSALKREIEALHTQLHNKLCDSNEEQREMESLQEENERLRNKQTILEAQLMEAQLIAMLPPSPLRLPGERRGQRHAADMNPDINVQEEREAALLKMEERMKEVELTLRNVKLLLQDKVSQLKEQLHKNSKADVLIKDLYVENAQLLKALEMSEQRQKVSEKKNYLLEEKISSLNKIVRELNPSPLTPVPYHYTRS